LKEVWYKWLNVIFAARIQISVTTAAMLKTKPADPGNPM
jgi:hypothetical protein